MASNQALAPVDDVSTPAPIQSESAAIVSMIERAARDPNVDIDKMERLLQMQERVLAQRARAAFAAGLAQLQQELPVVRERGKGDKNAKYALWEDLNEAIRPAMGRHGFSLTFRVGNPGNGRLAVTGVLMHQDGHSEETTMELPVDTSGSKNAVQAVGSSTSYGKRYVAMALLNVTSTGEDDDGRGGGGQPRISEEQATELRDLAESVGADLRRFLNFMRIESLADLPAARFEQAVTELKRKERR